MAPDSTEKIPSTPLGKPGPIEGLGGRVVGPTTPTRPLPRPTSPRGGDSNAVSDKVWQAGGFRSDGIFSSAARLKRRVGSAHPTLLGPVSRGTFASLMVSVRSSRGAAPPRRLRVRAGGGGSSVSRSDDGLRPSRAAAIPTDTVGPVPTGRLRHQFRCLSGRWEPALHQTVLPGKDECRRGTAASGRGRRFPRLRPGRLSCYRGRSARR